MRSRMMRRSVSSCDSPGPRVPMPPPVRERCVHSRVRRGSWYSSWASSTCRRPSCVWACRAKMSRIRRERSMTLVLTASSRARCWRRRELVVGDEDRVAGLRLRGHQLVDLALAHVVVGVHVAAVLPLRADDLGAGRVGQAGQLLDRFLGRPAGVVAGVDRDEEGALRGRGEIDHLFGHTAQDSRRGPWPARRVRSQEGSASWSPPARGRQTARRLQPLDVRLAAEPGGLAAGEEDVAAGVLGDRFLERQAAVDDGRAPRA